MAQGKVTLATAQGATWQILPDPQVTKWATNGTVTQTTDRSGASMTWGTNGSQTSVSATGLTTTRTADHLLTITTPTGASVTRGSDGLVTATGMAPDAQGMYDVGAGTQVAPNGVITTTLDDGSTLTEQANGVVTLHAVDGTETDWFPPGVSTQYPNGFVTRTHADGSSEAWYTADDTKWSHTGDDLQHPDSVYVRQASPAAPIFYQYGNGVQTMVPPMATPRPSTAAWLWYDHWREYMAGQAWTGSVETPNGAVLTRERPTDLRFSRLVAAGVRTNMWGGWGNMGVYPMSSYRLSDANGAGLAQLAASGRKFAIGASLDDPASLWVGDTVDETVQYGNNNIPYHWDYLIDGATHHSETGLTVWAITPPANPGLTASFVPYDPNATYATDPTPQMVDFAHITDLQGLHNNQGITDHYSFKLDGVAYVSDLLPPDVTVKPLSTLPPLPSFPTGGESMTTLSPTLWLAGLSGRTADRTLSLAADRPDSQALTVGAPTRPTVVTDRLALQTLINPVTGQEDQVTFTPDPWTPPSQSLPVPVAFISGLFKGAAASGVELADSFGAILKEMAKFIPSSADLGETVFNPNYANAMTQEQMTYIKLSQRVAQKYSDAPEIVAEFQALLAERAVNMDGIHKIQLGLDKGGAVGARMRVLLMLAVASLQDASHREDFVAAALRKIGGLTPAIEAQLQGGTSAAAQSNAAEARGYIAGHVFTELVLLGAPFTKSLQAVRTGRMAALLDQAPMTATQQTELAMQAVTAADKVQVAKVLNDGRMPANMVPVAPEELAVQHLLRATYGDAKALALEQAAYQGAGEARTALGTLLPKGAGAVTLADDAMTRTLELVAALKKSQVTLSAKSVEQLGDVVTRATLARAAQKGVAEGQRFLTNLSNSMQTVVTQSKNVGFSPTTYLQDVVDGMYQMRDVKGFNGLMAQFAGDQSSLGYAEQWRWASWWQRTHAANPITDIEESLQAAGRPIDFRLQDGTLVEVKEAEGSVPKGFNQDELNREIKVQARAYMQAQDPSGNVHFWFKNYSSAWETPLNALKAQLDQAFAGKNVHIFFHLGTSW